MTHFVTTQRFTRVQERASKRLPCPDCGKLVRRQRTFWQTLSPFNVDALGLAKDRSDILAELRAEADRWRVLPERCTPCRMRT